MTNQSEALQPPRILGVLNKGRWAYMSSPTGKFLQLYANTVEIILLTTTKMKKTTDDNSKVRSWSKRKKKK